MFFLFVLVSCQPSGTNVSSGKVEQDNEQSQITVEGGPDSSVTDTDNDGSQAITLKASAKSKLDNIVSYRVSANGTTYAEGAGPEVFLQEIILPVGSHTLLFEATDARGTKGSDYAVVKVKPAPSSSNRPPVANAGPDMNLTNVDTNLGVDKIRVKGSASDPENNIVSYIWKVNGVVVSREKTPAKLSLDLFFILGSNLLTLEVKDAGGLVTIDHANIVIKPNRGSNSLVAVAGGARIVTDNDQNGFEQVRMVGAVSSVNPIVLYQWHWRGQVLASGNTPSLLTTNLNLPLGNHKVKLEVTDLTGSKSSDEAVIGVSAPTIENANVNIVPANYNITENLVEQWDTGAGHWKDQAAFRFHCNPSHLLFDDPIVYPGQPGKSHLHMFFGNRTANGNSTYESLRKNGTSSCPGGPLNRSAYWMPAMLNENGKAVLADVVSIYYKTQPGAPKLPRGLRMIFGWNPDPTGKQDDYAWKCETGGGLHKSIPDVNCPAGSMLGGELHTPSCWDGKNLDSSDHRSHLAYPSYASGWGVAECPSTHPVMIPHFTMVAWFSHNGYSEYSNWKLASDHVHNTNGTTTVLPAGSSLHADWFGAWDDEIMQQWHDGCINNFLSCSGGTLGTGKGLKWNADFVWKANPRIVDPPIKPIQ